MNRINEIILKNAIPRVFVDEDSPEAESASSDVWRVDVGLKRGRVYCIDAASGTGKTSLCSFIYGVRRDYEGRILFDGNDIRKYNVAAWCELRRRHLSYLPQELDIFGELTALDNVMLKNRLTDYRTEAEIRRMFELLEIDNRIDRPAARMSVGQRQRVALIRALCQPFDFILLDEPVSHLDAANNAVCASIVVEEAGKQDAGIIFTSVGNRLSIPDPIILKL